MIKYAKIGALIAIFSILAGGFLFARNHYLDQGREEIQIKWDRDKLDRERAHKEALILAVAKVEEEYKRQLKINANVIADYERKLNEANSKISAERRAADNQRLRFNIERNKLCATPASAESSGSVKPDGAGEAITVELPDAITKRLYDIAESADREVTRLKAKVSAFQKWAIDNGHFEVAHGD